MEKLKPCPFCGNAEFSPHNLQSVQLVEQERNTKAYGLPAEPHKIYFVRCHYCFAQGGCGVSGYNALVKKTMSEAKARQLAVDKWNLRADQLAAIAPAQNVGAGATL